MRGSASCRKSRPRFGKPSRPLSRRSTMDARIFAEPKIDCHVHVLDPARFPYRADTHYAPMGQEIGTPAQLAQVMDAYGTTYALLVGPNSGYGLDNACMLDTIARGNGRFKGIAVVANDITLDELQALKQQGVVGVAWNVTFYGVLLKQVCMLFPDASHRRKLLWDTPRELFGFSDSAVSNRADAANS